MRRSSLSYAVVTTLALSPCLGGCAVAVVGGLAAAGGAGYEAAQERGLNGTFDDMNVTSSVNNALNNQYGNITTSSYGGRVLLTGTSPTQQAKFQAEQIARGIPGVKMVYNELAISPNQEPWDTAKDTWITTRVRSDLAFDANVRSGNYTIETDHQTVYLLGSARSQAELDRATQLARYVPGVQRVVSYVDIRTGVPYAQGSAPGPSQAGMPSSMPSSPWANGQPASPGYNGGAATPSAPSNAPIQVQKL